MFLRDCNGSGTYAGWMSHLARGLLSRASGASPDAAWWSVRVAKIRLWGVRSMRFERCASLLAALAGKSSCYNAYPCCIRLGGIRARHVPLQGSKAYCSRRVRLMQQGSGNGLVGLVVRPTALRLPVRPFLEGPFGSVARQASLRLIALGRLARRF